MIADIVSSPIVALQLVLLGVFLYFTLPRKAKNSDAPPMVKSTVKIPLLGQIIEFGMSPVKMVERCYKAYGPVFTVPVSNNIEYIFILYMNIWTNANAHSYCISNKFVSSLNIHRWVKKE